MRKRNPIIYVVVGFGVLLAVLSVIASARRAGTDASGSSTVATFAPYATTTAAPGGATTVKGRTTVTTPIAVPSTAARVPVGSTPTPTAPKGIASVRVSALPAEARETLRLIDAGGPFPYGQDGVVFENRERHLPGKPAGYYHEYTVVTPGSADRGARRVIVGGAGERFYTADHYDTFRLVVP